MRVMQQAKKDKQKYKRDLNRKNAIYNIYGSHKYNQIEIEKKQYWGS